MGEVLWRGFKMDEFLFEEHPAKIVYPSCKPNGRIVYRTEYFDQFADFDEEMVKRGYYLCFVEHESRWAPDHDVEMMARFLNFVADKLNADKRCIFVGLSCGGLQAARLAEEHPELTAVVYLDAPVLNILSMAGLGEPKEKDFWPELANTFGFSRSTVVNFRKSPIDNMKPLIDNNIPIIMLYGNADRIVYYFENGKVLEDYYRENGGTMKVICKSMEGHHPHGLEDSTPIIEFIEAHL